MTPQQDPWITRITAARRTASVLNHRGVLQRRTLRVYARRRGNAVEEVTAALEKRNDQGMCPGHLVSKGGLEPLLRPCRLVSPCVAQSSSATLFVGAPVRPVVTSTGQC